MAHPTLAAVLLAATLFLGSAISPLPKKLSAIPAYPKKVAPRGRKNLWAAKDPVVVPPLVALTTPVVTEDDPEVPTKDPEDVPAVAITTPVVTEDDSSEVPPNRSPPAHRLIHKLGARGLHRSNHSTHAVSKAVVSSDEEAFTPKLASTIYDEIKAAFQEINITKLKKEFAKPRLSRSSMVHSAAIQSMQEHMQGSASATSSGGQLKIQKHISKGVFAAHSAAPNSTMSGDPEATATCKCTSPNTGTAGHNQYECSDGTSAYCAETEPCYATGDFPKGEWAKGCGKAAADPDPEAAAPDPEAADPDLEHLSKSQEDRLKANPMEVLKLFLGSILEQKEDEMMFDGDADRSTWCKTNRAAYHDCMELIPKLPEDAPTPPKLAMHAIIFALEETDKQLKFMCEEYAQFHGRKAVVETNNANMVIVEKEFVEAITCQVGDRMCIGGQLGGMRLSGCTCTCDPGWNHGEMEACEKCTDIEWGALPWNPLPSDMYMAADLTRTCPKSGTRTRTVDCNCGSPKLGVEFDKSICAAHPNRLADSERCNYVPLMMGNRASGSRCLAWNGGRNVYAESCRVNDLSQGWKFQGSNPRGPSGRITHEPNPGMCLTFDSSITHTRRCWKVNYCETRIRVERHRRCSGWWIFKRCWEEESRHPYQSCSQRDECATDSTEGSNVELEPCNGNRDQQWRRANTGRPEEAVYVSAQNNKCITVTSDASAANKRGQHMHGGLMNAVVTNCNYQRAQLFWLVSATQKHINENR